MFRARFSRQEISIFPRSHVPHCRVVQARPDADATLLARSVLAALAPGLFTYLRQEEGRGIQQLKTGMDILINGLFSD